MAHQATSGPIPDQTGCAFSRMFETRQALVFDSLRVAEISTRSPSLHSLASSWAWYFADFMTILPYKGCLTRRSTSTVTVLFILSLTTRPVSVASIGLRPCVELPAAAVVFCSSVIGM